VITNIMNRPFNSERLFPSIGPDLYRDSDSTVSKNERGATPLLQFPHRRFSWTQRLLGLGLDPQGRAHRLLMLHQHAFEAEIAGRTARADFFWRELYRYGKRCWEDRTVWETITAVASTRAAVSVTDPLEIRQRVVNDIFIDTHCAFYNGRVRDTQALEPTDRAFVHADYIATLADLAGISADARCSLLIPPAKLRIDFYKTANRWEEAIRVCNDLLTQFPQSQDLQDELVELYVAAALVACRNGQSQEDNMSDAGRIETAIGYLEALRNRCPFNSKIYVMLAQCYHIRAIKLANGGALSDALAAVRWAQTYDPFFEAARKTEEQLTEMMKELQSQVEQIEAELIKQPGAQLNEDGRRMRVEAKKGFRPVTEVANSTRSAEIARDRNAAQARRVWHEIGLPEPKEGWDEQADTLLEALGKVFSSRPKTPANIPVAWAAVAKDSGLETLDRGPIETFLRRRLFEEADQDDAKEKAPSADPVQVLIAENQIRRGDMEPFGYWLFSRQDLRVKLQTAGAAVLLIIAGVFFVRDVNHRNIRDISYAQIREAAALHQDDVVIQAAENFLTSKVLAVDSRQEEVLRLYDQSFARWFVSQSHVIDPVAEERIGRYRTLVAK
jgi:tetratricopeptide (TPR) repeat protein